MDLGGVRGPGLPFSQIFLKYFEGNHIPKNNVNVLWVWSKVVLSPNFFIPLFLNFLDLPQLVLFKIHCF